jgi:hypothetical protein
MCWVTAQEQDIAEISILSRQSQGGAYFSIALLPGPSSKPCQFFISFNFSLLYSMGIWWVPTGYQGFKKNKRQFILKNRMPSISSYCTL